MKRRWQINLHGGSRDRAGRGQALVETALMLPILLMMLTGLAEFGFALNQYLNVLDAVREGARYASDGDPAIRSTNDCGSTDFYMKTACLVEQTASPLALDLAQDDIVISVYQIVEGAVWARLPTYPDGGEWHDPPIGIETDGEWHLYGLGGSCSGDTCHPSRFCSEDPDCNANPEKIDIRTLLDPAAPNTAVLVVELFYSYNQILKLPWLTVWVPDPIRMHTYTILPLSAAEPDLTP